MEFFEHLIGYRFTPDSYLMATLSFLMGLVSVAALRWMAKRRQGLLEQNRGGSATIVRGSDRVAGEKGMRVISVFFLVIWPLSVFVFMGESIDAPVSANG